MSKAIEEAKKSFDKARHLASMYIHLKLLKERNEGIALGKQLNEAVNNHHQALALLARPEPSISNIAIPCPDDDCCGCLEVKEFIDRPTCNECGKVFVLCAEQPGPCKTCEDEAIKEAMEAVEQRKQGRYKLVYDKPTRTIIAVPNPNYRPDCKPKCKTCGGSKEIKNPEYYGRGKEIYHSEFIPCPDCKPEPTEFTRKRKEINEIKMSEIADDPRPTISECYFCNRLRKTLRQQEDTIKAQGEECERRHDFLCGIKEIIDSYFEQALSEDK